MSDTEATSESSTTRAIQTHAILFAARGPWSGKPAEVLDPETVYEASLNPPPLAEREGGVWLHLNRSAPGADGLLHACKPIPEAAIEALLDEETRPRVARHGEGLVVILRGLNLNEDAEQREHELIAVRIWIDGCCIVSARKYRIRSIEAIQRKFEGGSPPQTAGEWLADLVEGLTERLTPAVEALEDKAIALEDEALTPGVGRSPKQMERVLQDASALRSRVIQYRRYLSPQREALARLSAEQASWLSDADRSRIREEEAVTARLIDELDAAAQRATLAVERIQHVRSEKLNQVAARLSVVATVALPLGVMTGLFGVNVGGLPGTESPAAFTIFCVVLTVVTIVLVVLFRKLRWL